MKSRAVIELAPFGETRRNSREAGATQEGLKAGDLVFSAPHAGFQEIANKGGHAQACPGRLDAEPLGDILAQSDSDIFHGTNIV
jgi:hypothetical protein